MKYVINDNETKSTKKAIKKFGKTEISKLNNSLKGSFTITHFRKYDNHHEVDVEFDGELFARVYGFKDRKWYTSKIYAEKGYSKIKINKFIKTNLLNEVKTRCAYFGIDVKWVSNIKKVKWI